MTVRTTDVGASGDAWVECAQGHRHWGRFGAAGVLLYRPGSGGDAHEVLLQHRALWSHHGGTWGLLGGARQQDESAVTAALREAAEEGGLQSSAVRVEGRYDDPHGGWSYTTVLASTGRGTTTTPTSAESLDLAWVPLDLVAAQPLHPGFRTAWPLLRRALDPVTVVVDAANVVGSRPNGWWLDRVGAARSLVRRIESLATSGLTGAQLPADSLDLVPLTHRWPLWAVVLEGAAREAAAGLEVPGQAGSASRVELRSARGEGDDEVVNAVRDAEGPVLVVTADRALRARCAAAGASLAGPQWLQLLLG